MCQTSQVPLEPALSALSVNASMRGGRLDNVCAFCLFLIRKVRWRTAVTEPRPDSPTFLCPAVQVAHSKTQASHFLHSRVVRRAIHSIHLRRPPAASPPPGEVEVPPRTRAICVGADDPQLAAATHTARDSCPLGDSDRDMGLFSRKQRSRSGVDTSPTDDSDGQGKYPMKYNTDVPLPRAPDPNLHPAAYLRSIYAVRERSQLVLEKAKKNQLRHFNVDTSKFPDTVSFVVSIIKVAHVS